MTKGGKKRRSSTHSESQDGSKKYIPQFNKKRKAISDSDENLEPTQSKLESTQPPVEEQKAAAPTSCNEDDTRNEVGKVAVETLDKEMEMENNTTVLPDTKHEAELPSDDDNVVKELSDTTGFTEKCNGEDAQLPDAITLATTAAEDDLSRQTINKTNESITSNDAVMVVDMASEQPETLGCTRSSEEEEPSFIDATTQVEISDKTEHIVNSKITSDPLVPALLDELSALNRLVMSCKRELETVRRRHDIWKKNNKVIK